MRDPARIPIVLDVIRKVWEKHPDLRLGQLIVDVTPRERFGSDPFFMEDDLLIEELVKFAKSTKFQYPMEDDLLIEELVKLAESIKFQHPMEDGLLIEELVKFTESIKSKYPKE